MNHNIIPNGASEAMTNGAITRDALVVQAITDLTITNLVFTSEAGPANGAKVTGLTLKAGCNLFNVHSMAFTGTCVAIYRH